MTRWRACRPPRTGPKWKPEFFHETVSLTGSLRRHSARSVLETHGVLLALGAEIPSVTNGRVFRRWTHQRAFKEYWSETCRRVGIQGLHFHDLRHTFATRLQRIGVDYEVREALLGRRMPGMTANYSHGGPKWDRKRRPAVEGLEKAYPLYYGLSYETKAALGQTAEVIDLKGESAGIRTQDPRLKERTGHV